MVKPIRKRVHVQKQYSTEPVPYARIDLAALIKKDLRIAVGQLFLETLAESGPVQNVTLEETERPHPDLPQNVVSCTIYYDESTDPPKRRKTTRKEQTP